MMQSTPRKRLNLKPSSSSLKKASAILLTLSAPLTLLGCNDDDDSTERTLPDAIEYNASAPALPEGLDYDSLRSAFIVSSASTGTVGLVDGSGNYSALIPPTTFGGNGTFGIKVDQSNERLHVVSSNLSDPLLGYLYIFDLITLELLHTIDLAALNGGLSFANDVTVDTLGNAYVTNSDQGIIYKVDMNGSASIYFQDSTYTPTDPATETGFNGIDYHPDGYLIVGHFANSAIYKISMESTPTLTEVDLPQAYLVEPDGIEINDDQLVVVNNGSLGGFISQFNMDASWSSGSLDGDTFPTGARFPTAVTIADNGVYVNNSYFNFPGYGNNPTDYLLSRANFDASFRYSGTASDIPRLNTPISPFGYGVTYPAPLLADCTDALADEAVNLSGDWMETDVMIEGVLISADANPYSERIEQCGNRIIVLSSGLIHDIYKADGTLYNGVNDVNVLGLPTLATGLFSDDGLILTPVMPVSLGVTLPDVTRELETDDTGEAVMRFFNAGIGRVIYMKRQ